MFSISSGSLNTFSSSTGVLQFPECSVVAFSSNWVNLPSFPLGFSPLCEGGSEYLGLMVYSLFFDVFSSLSPLVLCFVPTIAICGFFSYVFSNFSLFCFSRNEYGNLFFTSCFRILGGFNTSWSLSPFVNE